MRAHVLFGGYSLAEAGSVEAGAGRVPRVGLDGAGDNLELLRAAIARPGIVKANEYRRFSASNLAERWDDS